MDNLGSLCDLATGAKDIKAAESIFKIIAHRCRVGSLLSYVNSPFASFLQTPRIQYSLICNPYFIHLTESGSFTLCQFYSHFAFHVVKNFHKIQLAGSLVS